MGVKRDACHNPAARRRLFKLKDLFDVLSGHGSIFRWPRLPSILAHRGMKRLMAQCVLLLSCIFLSARRATMAHPTMHQLPLTSLYQRPRPQKGWHLDPSPDSVGLLFGAPYDDDATHVWLPLDRRVYPSVCLPLSFPALAACTAIIPGECLQLPLYPLTARITTMMASTPERASVDLLAGVRCTVFPRVAYAAESVDGDVEVSFSKSDGLVRLADDGGPFCLHGAEVEAYECSASYPPG